MSRDASGKPPIDTGQDQTEQRWRIGELGRLAGLNPKTIRYYEEAGLLPAPARTQNGYRIYTEDTMERLAFIGAAKDFGFALGEIREILAVRDRDEVPCLYVFGLVREKLADLQNRIERLELLSENLEELVREIEALPSETIARKGNYCHAIENRRLRREQAELPNT